MKRINYIPAFFLSILLFSCKQKTEQTLFELVDNTGINFRNDVEDGKKENSFLFRNFYNGGGVAIGDINNDGNIQSRGNITAYYTSDRSLKTNVTNIPDALYKVNQINGVEFDWTDEYITKHGGVDGYFNRKHDVGVIAQEIEMVLPEVVAMRDDGTKAVRYEKIVALLIEAVKELSAEVEELKKKG